MNKDEAKLTNSHKVKTNKQQSYLSVTNEGKLAEKHKKVTEKEARLVSYAPDKSTCTLNIDGEEVYFNRGDKLSLDFGQIVELK